MKSNIVELVENFKKVQSEMMAKLKADGQEELKVVFKDIFDKHPGLKKFAYLGYTPGFNDGDPCYHSGQSSVGVFEKCYSNYSQQHYYSSDCENTELEEFLSEQGQSCDDTDADEEELTSVNKDCATLQQASYDVAALEDIVELVYDTDYIIKVELNDDGSVSVDVDDYDCGH